MPHHVGEIRRNVKKSSRRDGFIVRQGDVSDRRADAGSKNPEPRESLLLEPPQAPPRIVHRLTVRLQGQTDV